MKSCTGKIKAWKYVRADGSNPHYQFSEKYEVKKTYIENDYNENEFENCGKGLNVATLKWCYFDDGSADNQYLEVEFTAKDIVAIPHTTDGKFRVKKMKVIRKISRKEAEDILRIDKDCAEKVPTIKAVR